MYLNISESVLSLDFTHIYLKQAQGERARGPQ